jgi:LSD1 subclass zinc finger protein
MREWIQRFMYARYGQDDLNRFLCIFALILTIINTFIRWAVLSSLATAFLFLCFFRMFSRNSEKRVQENLAFLRFFNRFKSRFSQRKTHRFYKCPTCKQRLRVPKGKGNISIRCPKCQTIFKKKT